MSKDGAHALFLSFDGLTDPLGGSQILPYLEGLVARGHRLDVISLEKPEPSETERAAVRAACERAGIGWHAIRYRRWPPILSTLVNLAMMRRKAFVLHHDRRFRIVHCRSYVAALVGLAMKRRFGSKFLFDMRGFWADERLEGGQWRRWPTHAIYRFFKTKERQFLAEADMIVSLTETASRYLDRQMGGGTNGRIRTIPCCVDMQLFDPANGEMRAKGRQLLGITPETSVLAYLGSLGGNYLLDEMLDFYVAYRALVPDARFLFVTREQERTIRMAAGSRGIAQAELIIRPASRDEVPMLVAAADLGIAFKRPTHSAKACSPTKIGEMLSLGIPVVANEGVGDVAMLFANHGAGVLVRAFDRHSLGQAAQAAARLEADAEQVRQLAETSFDLPDGIDAYDRIYRELLNG